MAATANNQQVPVSPLQLEQEWKLPDRGVLGIASFILAETALFIIFVIAYVFYIGKSLSGPYPKDVLDVPIVASICLLSSSWTIVLAERALKHHLIERFKFWWGLTIALGIIFLGYTAKEWRELIVEHHLTMATNLFGTTYYALVGLHASHVVVGLAFLGMVWTLTMLKFPIETQERRVTFLSWYWHFVDVVWVIVFTVVYVIGR